ncbi:50S ribosomal protein L18 [Candidatus Pacearchaeota archaeon]|nr:50S ribosomal protein L18 [Candidatus Pacearchaeota archaeon]
MKTQKRRRKEFKTDYSKRLNLLKGERPRIVLRKTNRYVIGQYVTSKETQDKVEIGLTSKDLLKYGWPKEFSGSLKSNPASYLTGFLMGKKISKTKKEVPIFDIGMTMAIKKSKIYSFLKGVVDAGVKIPHDKSIFPEESRISGKNLKKDFSADFDKIKLNIEKNE